MFNSRSIDDLAITKSYWLSNLSIKKNLLLEILKNEWVLSIFIMKQMYIAIWENFFGICGKAYSPLPDVNKEGTVEIKF